MFGCLRYLIFVCRFSLVEMLLSASYLCVICWVLMAGVVVFVWLMV